ncbi:MAG TPA: alpha/beta hydrolase [Candidatus Limnocylindria bacterium]
MHRLEVEFTNGGVTLAGTVTLPDGEGPWPGIVTVHGASAGSRDFRLFTHLESLLAPAGMAVLRYDRRGSGASAGDFYAASFEALADDALAALGTLAGQPGVDPTRIGLFGFSQGGWIAPLAASRSASVAFMVLVGACAVTPAEQMSYVAATQIAEAGHGPAAVRRALEVRAAVDEALRGRRPRREAAELVRTISGEPWFELAWLSAPPAEPNDEDRKWRLEMDYDVRPLLEGLDLRVLLLHGSHDRWTPVPASRDAWQTAFAGRPGLLDAELLAGTGHYPTLASGQAGEEDAPISPDYEAVLLRWLRRLT